MIRAYAVTEVPMILAPETAVHEEVEPKARRVQRPEMENQAMGKTSRGA